MASKAILLLSMAFVAIECASVASSNDIISGQRVEGDELIADEEIRLPAQPGKPIVLSKLWHREGLQVIRYEIIDRTPEEEMPAKIIVSAAHNMFKLLFRSEPGSGINYDVRLYRMLN